MIQSFADPEAELIWSGQRSRKLPADIRNIALRNLRLLKPAHLAIFAFLREIDLKP